MLFMDKLIIYILYIITIQNIDSQSINKLSDIQLTILNNDKIEDNLNVIIVHFNPMKFKRMK